MDPMFGTGIEEGRMGDYVFNQEGENPVSYYPCIIKIAFEQHWIV